MGKAKARSKSTTPLLPKEGRNGAPATMSRTKIKNNFPTQAKRRLEWGTRAVHSILRFAQDFACGLPLRSRPQNGSTLKLAFRARSLRLRGRPGYADALRGRPRRCCPGRDHRGRDR